MSRLVVNAWNGKVIILFVGEFKLLRHSAWTRNIYIVLRFLIKVRPFKDKLHDDRFTRAHGQMCGPWGQTHSVQQCDKCRGVKCIYSIAFEICKVCGVCGGGSGDGGG